MKKVLLVTLQGANIGNRLQNYALQTVIERLDYEVITPIYFPKEYDELGKRVKFNIKAFLGFLGVSKFKTTRLVYNRKKAFESFDKEYIKNRIRVDFDVQNQLKRIDLVCGVSGSDQVWHNWSKNVKELYYFYLSFIPYEKRISYAASFGFESFPSDDVSIHNEGINGIKYLSCREKSARYLIKELTDRDAELVLDPTLLLGYNDWISIVRKPKYQIEESFILVYCLGEKTAEFYETIKREEQKAKIRLIDIFDPKQEEYYSTNPTEFLWLVNHAELVLTDSFHAVVFSLIFHKKFVVFKRFINGIEDKMFDRIYTLLHYFDAECFIYDSNGNNLEYDYSIFDETIIELRKDSLLFLEKSIMDCDCN